MRRSGINEGERENTHNDRSGSIRSTLHFTLSIFDISRITNSHRTASRIIKVFQEGFGVLHSVFLVRRVGRFRSSHDGRS